MKTLIPTALAATLALNALASPLDHQNLVRKGASVSGPVKYLATPNLKEIIVATEPDAAQLIEEKYS